MPDAHGTVAEIKAFLNSQAPKSVEDLSSLATAYRDLCEGANARLKRCGEWLRAGLRSEAIHHAEIEPDVLNSVAILDLPQIDAWEAVCQEHGLDHPPRLWLDVAAEINKAYVVEKEMRPLLKKLRLLSLAKAPLRERLEVLRAVAGMDPDNPIWAGDIEKFEAARLGEIAKAAWEAAQREDLEALHALCDELMGGAWQVRVEPKLRTAVGAARRQVQTTKALRELNDLLPDLHEAYSALSFEECATLMEQWERIVSENDLSVPPAMQEQLQPVADWVGGEKNRRRAEAEFADACFRLQQALDNETSTTDLRRIYQHAVSFGRAIPEEAERKYHREIEAREIKHRRKVRLAGAVIFVALAAAGAGVLILVQRGIFRSRLEERRVQITKLIDGGQLDEAERAFQAAPPEFLPELADLRRLLTERYQQEEQRQRKFRESVVAAREKHKALTEANPDGLSAVHLREAQALLAEVEGEPIPKTGPEKIDERILSGQIEETIAKWQRAINDRFLAQVDGLSEQVNKLDADSRKIGLSAAARKARESEWDKLKADAGRLAAAEGVSAGAKQPLELLVKRLESVRRVIDVAAQRIGDVELEQKDLAAVVAQAGSPATLAKALAAFAAGHPGSQKAADFRKAVQQLPDWAAVEEWAKIAAAWKFRFVPERGLEIPGRIKTVEKYLTDHPRSPFVAALKEYLGYLSQAQRAVAEDSPWKTDLPDAMTSPVMKLWCVRTTDGKVYYIPSNSKVKKGTPYDTVEVVLTPRVDKTKTMACRNGLLKPPEESPQSKLARDVQSRLAGLKVSEWETIGLEVAEMTRKATDVDPVLRMILLKRVLGCLVTCGWGVEEEVKSTLSSLGALDTSDVSWMDPSEQTAAAARTRMDEALGRVAAFEGLMRRVERKRKETMEPLAFECLGYGMAMRDGDGRWQVGTPVRLSPAADGCKAMIVVVGGAAAPATLRRVGTVQSRSAVLTDSAMSNVPEGTLVILCRKVGSN